MFLSLGKSGLNGLLPVCEIVVLVVTLIVEKADGIRVCKAQIEDYLQLQILIITRLQ